MDEEYGESVDTSADMDVSDADVAEDIPADIPDDIPEDIPEDDYSDSDVADDVSEDVFDDAVTDEAGYDDVDDSIEEDSIEPEVEEVDESIDDFEEDSYDDSEIPSEGDVETDDIPEDSDEVEEAAGDEVTDVEDVPEDTGSDDETVQDEFSEDEIPEDVPATDVTDETADADASETADETTDIEDTDVYEQPEDVTVSETADETADSEDTAATEQPEDMTDTETEDETADAADTDTAEQPEDVTDVDGSDTTEQPEDVTDTEATNETADADTAETADEATDTEDTAEQPQDVTNTETADEFAEGDDTDAAEQPENMTDTEAEDESAEADNTDAAEQPENMTDTEAEDESAEADNTDAAEQPEDMIDTEATDETADVEDTNNTEQPEDATETEAADKAADVEDADVTEQMDDVTDTEVTDEAADVGNTDTTERSENQSDLETYDYETSPETQDAVNPETSGEFVSAENPYRERWEQFGEKFSDEGKESEGWGSLKDVPISGEAQPDTGGAEDGVDAASLSEQPDVKKASDTTEINSISDYMNAHNYGPDDFATYSQDPQWRQLMRQEYPDYELPEMARESANAQLSQYMNDHNYGVDDYAEYSQDPIWRELHSSAFPDDDLSPLNDISQEQKKPAIAPTGDNNPLWSSKLDKGNNTPPRVCPICGQDPCVCNRNSDSKDINPPHPTCPTCGQYPCICDTRDDQGNYPTLKSMESKEYFDDAKSSYYKAEDVAGESGLKLYKAHDMDHHIDKVIERSAEALDVINEITESHCDKKDLAAAALYHDTGMDGGDKYEASDGDGIRKNHSMTSAIHVLSNREALENDGCNADQVAALCLLHSKTCSGVKNLADNEQIERAFDKLQSEVDNYNAEHPETPVTFNRNAIDVEKFKYNAASLRLGDAYGHDSSSTKTQSGGYYVIDFGEREELSHEEWGEEFWKDEIKDSNLTFYENDESYSINESNDPSGNTRMYQFGEGNIASMHSKIGGDGEFESVIDVNSGMAKPLCTLECILERLKELKTADELFPHSTTINLYGECDEKHMALYEGFARDNEAEYGRIQINHVGGKYNGNN